jgi:hypothetical protein
MVELFADDARRFSGRNLSLLIFASGETASNERFLFLDGGFGRHGRAFLGAGAAGFGLFLAGLLLVGFRGFVAHNFICTAG